MANPKTPPRLTDAEIDAQIPGARAAEKADRVSGLRARLARYDKRTERVVLELTNGSAFAFPAQLVRGLEHASASERSAVTLAPSGSAVVWNALNVDMSVPGVLAMTFGRQLGAQALGAAGGAARSDAKSRAAKANGAKGGRPRKRLVPSE